MERRPRRSPGIQVAFWEIFADGEKIGTIVIGRGSLTWYGKNRQKGKRLSWSRFAELMDRFSYE